MSNKYRIKLKNDRIIGPFSIEKIGEMYIKKIIDGTEECQLFPGGDWEIAESVLEISQLFINISGNKITLTDLIKEDESATLVNLSLSEFRKKIKDEEVKDPDEKTKDSLSEFLYKTEDSNSKEADLSITKSIVGKIENETNELANDKTRIIDNRKKNISSSDKTIILDPNYNPKDLQEDEEVESDEEMGANVKLDKKIEEAINVNDETAVISTNDLLSEIKDEAKELEQELSKAVVEKEEVDEVVDDNVEEEEIQIKKNGMKPIVAFAFAAIFLVFLFPDNEPEIKTDGGPKYTIYSFPLIKNIIEEEESISLFNKGMDEYIKGRYFNKQEAVKLFKASLESKLENNPALGKLILCYAELTPNAKNRNKARQVLFKLLTKAKSETYNNRDIALGAAIFFYHEGKYKTAINYIENFIRHRSASLERLQELTDEQEQGVITAEKITEIDKKLKKDEDENEDELSEKDKLAYVELKNEIRLKLDEIKRLKEFINKSAPTLKMFSYYLLIMMEMGKFSDARKLVNKMNNTKNLNLEAYIALAKFHRYDENYEVGRKLLEEASQKFKSFVIVWIEYARYVLRGDNKDTFSKLLEGIKVLNYESSPFYYAKYLELRGVLSAMNKKNDQAAIFFRKAMELYPSPELVSKLSSLELGGTSSVEKLIVETKIIDKIRKSNEMAEQLKWRDAFLNAIEAVDLDPSYIPAKLQLAKIQTQRGYYSESLTTLKELYKNYPTEEKIVYALIESYIAARQFDNAIAHIRLAGSTKLITTARHAFVVGKYYETKGDILQALKNYHLSKERNPLDEEVYFKIARILLNGRRYNRSKVMLLGAIDLDPENLNYHLLYANILNEMESAKVAIGYLRKFLERHKDNAKLIGNIAKYYYQDGQHKEFNYYLKIFENLPQKDEVFYRFLIENAKLEDRHDEVIKYYSKLLKLVPGDLSARLDLGVYYLNFKKLESAEEIFADILNRLIDYPMANYYLGKISNLRGQYDKAIVFADKELKITPNKEFGYFVKGIAYIGKKEFALAMRNFESSISRNGQALEVLVALGDMKYKQNYLEESREYFTRAHALDKMDPYINKMLGIVYKDIGQGTIAANYLKNYLDLSPNAKDKEEIETIIRHLK